MRWDSYLDSIFKLSQLQSADWKSWVLLGRIGASLCFTTSIDQYLLGTRLLHKVFNVPQQEAIKLGVEIDDVWKCPMELEAILIRGVTAAETVQETLWLAETLIRTHPKGQMNNIIIVTFIIYALQCISKNPVTAAQSAISFIDSSGCISTFSYSLTYQENSVVAEFREAFTKLNIADLPLNKQPSAKELLDAFFSPFGQQFSKDFVFAVDLLLLLLRRGNRKWRVLILELLNRILRYYHLLLSIPNCKLLYSTGAATLDTERKRQVMELVVYYSQSFTGLLFLGCFTDPVKPM